MALIVFIFRDPKRKGTSIEEIYNGIIEKLDNKYETYKYYYRDQDPFWKNAHEINKLKADIVHITGGIYFLVPFLKNTKNIITIHDIGRLHELFGIRKWIYKLLWFKIPTKLADSIIVVSDFTRNEIIRHFGNRLTNKITRIYNPLPGFFVPYESTSTFNIPVILQVGTIANKNVENLIRGLKGITCHLRLIGRLTDEQQKLLDENNIEYSNIFEINYQEVYREYVNADLVVFVSSFEGFGMPVIEAQAVGRPVICSSVASLPEIAGLAAEFIYDPNSVIEIHQRIEKLIADPGRQKQLIIAGFENVKRFDSKEILSQYIDVYQQLLLTQS